MRRRSAVSSGFLVLLMTVPFGVWAKTMATDVSNGSISCNTVNAVATFKPALVNFGTVTSTQLKMKGSVAGCNVTGVGGLVEPIVRSGKFSGTLAGTSNDCQTFLGSGATDTGGEPLTGTLTFNWKADPSTPIVPKASTVTITAIVGTGLFTAPWGARYLGLSLGSNGGTGAFQAGGGSFSNNEITSEDSNAVLGGCVPSRGLTTLHVGLGTLELDSGSPAP
ncbi:MAG: hypothetical protein E6J72_19740 [Deltaproteobacteria bacterium]|nr:MAG: hypothetical protein E6J72_19740 [Deltaproteobacteria bacterium]